MELVVALCKHVDLQAKFAILGRFYVEHKVFKAILDSIPKSEIAGIIDSAASCNDCITLLCKVLFHFKGEKHILNDALTLIKSEFAPLQNIDPHFRDNYVKPLIEAGADRDVSKRFGWFGKNIPTALIAELKELIESNSKEAALVRYNQLVEFGLDDLMMSELRTLLDALVDGGSYDSQALEVVEGLKKRGIDYDLEYYAVFESASERSGQKIFAALRPYIPLLILVSSFLGKTIEAFFRVDKCPL